MFQDACLRIRESLYGVIGFGDIPIGEEMRIAGSNGTGFMIAPGIIITAAHLTHIENDPKKPNYSKYAVIRAPDIYQNMEDAELIAEDPFRDIALLRIKNPRSRIHVTLEKKIILTGASCGSLGFPLAAVDFEQLKCDFTPRFQGGHISIYGPQQTLQGRKNVYETDTIMYTGSSGSPGFLVNGNVFGMSFKTLVQASLIGGTETSRLAITLWVPSMDIISFAKENDINI